MITFVAIAVLALVLAPQPSSSQTQSPYIGFETRPIKSLSDQQVGDLRAGRGMGLALAAELNGYPGPAHVMELAGSLELTEGQRTRVEALLAAMKAEAGPTRRKAYHAGGGAGAAVCRQDHHRAEPYLNSACDRADPSDIESRTSQVSSLHQRNSHPGSNQAVCRIARIFERSTRRASARLPSTLSPSRHPFAMCRRSRSVGSGFFGVPCAVLAGSAKDREIG
jgi:hypothetical protein